jgi:hypothetical protein
MGRKYLRRRVRWALDLVLGMAIRADRGIHVALGRLLPVEALKVLGLGPRMTSTAVIRKVLSVYTGRWIVGRPDLVCAVAILTKRGTCIA